VTHDQVEAMTLGQRVAVMRDGRVQQVDVPQRLYTEPANLFVAAFIGSPAMNLVAGRVDDGSIAIGEYTIPLARDHRPSAAADDGRVIVGVRPEAFEDAAYAPSELPQIDARVEVLEELGSDAYIFFETGADPVVVEAARTEEDEETSLLADRATALFAARVDPRTDARVGQTIRLSLDPARLYFFSPDSGESLLDHAAATATA
jgi:multiple sugar transport system ATP-binding protein